MPTNSAQIRSLLLPGLRGVEGKYEQIPRQYDKIYTKYNSKQAFERTAEMAYLPLAQIKTEGGQIPSAASPGERFIYNAEHLEVALMYAMTRKAIDDNQYKTEFAPANLGLMESFNQTKEIYGASLLNSAQVYNPAVGADGVALCSTNHPIDGSFVPNTPTIQQDLNEATLLNSMTSIRINFRDQAGIKMYARARKLIIPPTLEPVAIRLTKTELRPGTADNDVNAIHSTAGGLAEGYLVNDYLTSQSAWFLQTNIDGLMYLERMPFEMDMWVDSNTQNLLVSGYERYAFSYKNFRAIYGLFPTQ